MPPSCSLIPSWETSTATVFQTAAITAPTAQTQGKKTVMATALEMLVNLEALIATKTVFQMVVKT